MSNKPSRKTSYWTKNLGRAAMNLHSFANQCESLEGNACFWGKNVSKETQTEWAKKSAQSLRDTLPFLKVMVSEIERALEKLKEEGF